MKSNTSSYSAHAFILSTFCYVPWQNLKARMKPPDCLLHLRLSYNVTAYKNCVVRGVFFVSSNALNLQFHSISSETPDPVINPQPSSPSFPSALLPTMHRGAAMPSRASVA